MNLFTRDEARPGRPLLYVGTIAYAVAATIAFITNSPSGGALLWIPLLLTIAALIFTPFVFVASMLWGIAPIDFSYAKWVLRRHYRWIVGAGALASVALALARFAGLI